MPTAAADCRPCRADEPPPPLVTPCLDNLDLPFADDDPVSCTSLADAGGAIQTAKSTSPTRRAPAAPSAAPTWGAGAGRRSSGRRQSVLARAQSVRRPGRATAGSGRARTSQAGYRDRRAVPDDRKGEPTHFRWNASVRLKKSRRTSESYAFRRKSTDSVSATQRV